MVFSAVRSFSGEITRPPEDLPAGKKMVRLIKGVPAHRG